MIIECPNCTSRFKVKDEAIGSSGRFVRCSICSHEWVATKDNSAINEASSQNADISEGVENDNTKELKADLIFKDHLSTDGGSTLLDTKVEAEAKEILKDRVSILYRILKTHIWLFLSKASVLVAVITLLLLVLFYHQEKIVSSVPGLQNLYNAFSLYENDGLKITNINAVISPVTNETTIKLRNTEIAIIVKNISALPKTLGSIRFSIFDKDRNKIDSLEMKPNKIINAEQMYTVSGKFDNLPSNSIYVIVEIGNDAEISMHKIDNLV